MIIGRMDVSLGWCSSLNGRWVVRRETGHSATSLPHVHGSRRRNRDMFLDVDATRERPVTEARTATDEPASPPLVKAPGRDRLSGSNAVSIRTAEVANDDGGTAPLETERVAQGLPGRGRPRERAFPGA